MDYGDPYPNHYPLVGYNPDYEKSQKIIDSQHETKYIDTSHINTVDSDSDTLFKDPLVDKIKDNSWKKYFLIKWLIIQNFFYRHSPVVYFMIVSYFGSRLGTKIFDRHIKKILEKTVN